MAQCVGEPGVSQYGSVCGRTQGFPVWLSVWENPGFPSMVQCVGEPGDLNYVLQT